MTTPPLARNHRRERSVDHPRIEHLTPPPPSRAGLRRGLVVSAAEGVDKPLTRKEWVR